MIPFPNAHTFYSPQQRLSDPAVQIDLMNYRPHQPYTTQYNLTIQRQLVGDWSLMVGYLGSQSHNNSRNVNWNASLPTAIVNGDKCYSVPGSPCFNGTTVGVQIGRAHV